MMVWTAPPERRQSAKAAAEVRDWETVHDKFSRIGVDLGKVSWLRTCDTAF
jgi:hypothetical protein